MPITHRNKRSGKKLTKAAALRRNAAQRARRSASLAEGRLEAAFATAGGSPALPAVAGAHTRDGYAALRAEEDGGAVVDPDCGATALAWLCAAGACCRRSAGSVAFGCVQTLNVGSTAVAYALSNFGAMAKLAIAPVAERGIGIFFAIPSSLVNVSLNADALFRTMAIKDKIERLATYVQSKYSGGVVSCFYITATIGALGALIAGLISAVPQYDGVVASADFTFAPDGFFGNGTYAPDAPGAESYYGKGPLGGGTAAANCVFLGVNGGLLFATSLFSMLFVMLRRAYMSTTDLALRERLETVMGNLSELSTRFTRSDDADKHVIAEGLLEQLRALQVALGRTEDGADGERAAEEAERAILRRRPADEAPLLAGMSGSGGDAKEGLIAAAGARVDGRRPDEAEVGGVVSPLGRSAATTSHAGHGADEAEPAWRIVVSLGDPDDGGSKASVGTAEAALPAVTSFEYWTSTAPTIVDAAKNPKVGAALSAVMSALGAESEMASLAYNSANGAFSLIYAQEGLREFIKLWRAASDAREATGTRVNRDQLVLSITAITAATTVLPTLLLAGGKITIGSILSMANSYMINGGAIPRLADWFIDTYDAVREEGCATVFCCGSRRRRSPRTELGIQLKGIVGAITDLLTSAPLDEEGALAHVSSGLKELLSGPRFAAFKRAVEAVQRLDATTPLGSAGGDELGGSASMGVGARERFGGQYGAFADEGATVAIAGTV